MFLSITARLSIERVFIAFGHCNATMLLNSGFDLKVVSEHLGHCDISVTADIYAEVLRSMKINAAWQVELKLK